MWPSLIHCNFKSTDNTIKYDKALFYETDKMTAGNLIANNLLSQLDPTPEGFDL